MGPLRNAGACASHKLLKHVDRHSRTGEYRFLCPNGHFTEQSMERQGRKGALGDDLSSFHRDTLPWTPAVRPRTALFLNDSTKIHKYIVGNIDIQKQCNGKKGIINTSTSILN